ALRPPARRAAPALGWALVQHSWPAVYPDTPDDLVWCVTSTRRPPVGKDGRGPAWSAGLGRLGRGLFFILRRGIPGLTQDFDPWGASEGSRPQPGDRGAWCVAARESRASTPRAARLRAMPDRTDAPGNS